MASFPLSKEELLNFYPQPSESRLNRPWIRANFATTPNGVVQINGTSSGVSGPPDKKVFNFLREHCDAVLIGASTARKEGYSVPKAPPSPGRAPLLVVVSNSLDLPESSKFLNEDSPPLIATSELSLSRHASIVGRIAHRAEVKAFGKESVDLNDLLAYLLTRDIELVLCEGGPALFSQLLKKGLIDELCLTISPRIGSGEPSGIAVIGGADPIEMSLGSNFEVDSYLFCRYLIRQSQ
ncbi:MAG: pyrimidine reductase family protein [Actinomycetota bacterium]|nr:MAG: pyrimidine reductase family protein [Actinomycetota bacterium]